MDRKNRRVTYLTGANATFNAYGMNDDQKKKKNKKKNTIQSRIRMAILIFALIGVLIVCVIYALTGITFLVMPIFALANAGVDDAHRRDAQPKRVALRRQRDFL